MPSLPERSPTHPTDPNSHSTALLNPLGPDSPCATPTCTQGNVTLCVFLWHPLPVTSHACAVSGTARKVGALGTEWTEFDILKKTIISHRDTSPSVTASLFPWGPREALSHSTPLGATSANNIVKKTTLCGALSAISVFGGCGPCDQQGEQCRS